MDANDEILQVPRDIRSAQRQEAIRSRRRWQLLFVFLACAAVVAAPNVFGILWRWLVYAF